MQSSSPERRWEREGILKSSLTEQAEAKASVDMECIPKVVRIECTSEELISDRTISDKDNITKLTFPESQIQRKEALIHTN